MRSETYSILVQVKLQFDKQDKIADAEVEVHTETPGVPFPVAMIAAENLMTMVAMDSPAGFDKAIDLLVKGARSNKVTMFHGNKVV